MKRRIESPHVLFVVVGLAVGCGSERAAPPPAEPPSTGTPTASPPDPPGEPDTRRERGEFYSITVPVEATRAQPNAPEIIEAVYVLSPEEGLFLSIFRPMPEQTDLESWTTTSETILEGLPSRHDDAEVSGMQARLGVFPGELRWTVVADGNGLLFRCFSPEPRDEPWMREHCEDTVTSVALVRPIQ